MTTFDNKSREAAHKAVYTLRTNLLENTNRKQIKKLSEEIASLQFSIDDDFSIEGIIAREINKTTWKSFCRFGDRRSATKAMILTWIDNKAAPLDTQSMFISEHYCVEILPDELANFIMDYDRGKGFYPAYRQLSDLKNTFKQLTGFHYNRKFLQQYFHKAELVTGLPF